MKNNLSLKLKNGKINSKFLAKIMQKEFIDSCENIIIDSQPKFINNFYNKIFLLLKNYYSINIFSETKELNNLLYQNKIDFITNVYTPMFKLCSYALNHYNLKSSKIEENKNISYLSNYRPHCMLSETNEKNNINEIALHFCGGKLIIVSENNTENGNNNKNNDSFSLKNNSYIICTKCRKCYLDECIPMICCNCNMLFYSEVIPYKIKKNNCYLATWYKYHCKNINNEKMSCIKCGNDFWIKNNKLFCKNCKFEIESINIIWTCLICNADFNSEAKVYNKYEFKIAQLILKEALIYKKIAIPSEFPCKCFQNKIKLKGTNFFHLIKNNSDNKECKGLIYFCEINNKKYLVCSQCFNINSINKFKWTCPLCLKNFFCCKIKILNTKTNNNYNKSTNKTSGNINLQKNILVNSISLNSKIKSSKYSPKKHQKTISIIDPYNPLKNINNIKKGMAFLSPNKTQLIKLKINNSNSQKKKKYIQRISSLLSSSPSKEKKILHKRIYTISNNGNITNKNRSKNKIKKDKSENKNKTYNNSYFKDLNIRKKRNLSVLQIEIKKDIFLTSFQNSKNDGNHIKGNDIISDLSNYNTFGKKENSLYFGSNLNLKKKNINNSINNNKKTIDYKDNENLNLLERLKNSNNDFTYKINNALISQKISDQSKKRKRKCENNSIINSKEHYNQKNLLNHKKGNKSFYIRCNKNLLLLNPVSTNKNMEREIIIKAFNKRNSLKNKKLKINSSLIGHKSKIHNKSINTTRILRKNRNIILKGKNNLLNYSISSRKIINNTYMKNKSKAINLNNLTISSLSKSIIKNDKNNSKTKKNKTSDKIKKVKVKNIRITIDNPQIINNINYNLSISTRDPKNQDSKNNKISENSKNILNYFLTKKKYNWSIEKKELKKFDINEYNIITQLGQGSFGKIYLAKDSKNKIFSIKKILLSEELDVKSVIEEYNMCYNFSHPNIIKILGIYSTKLDKTTFVVYVLMEVGISDWDKEINSLKAKNIHYSESELFIILKQIVSACSFLQKNNISHRDIKPQNILVFKNKVYKLIDFGEATRIEDMEKNGKSLLQYSLKGTELYMSPLLFNGLRAGQIDVNHNIYKSDVYSLGLCMLYASACLDKPLFEIRRMIEMEKIKNYIKSILNEYYSEKLINIIISMLEIHEQNRPDFIELEKILENF